MLKLECFSHALAKKKFLFFWPALNMSEGSQSARISMVHPSTWQTGDYRAEKH
jgi:hypothetical protein